MAYFTAIIFDWSLISHNDRLGLLSAKGAPREVTAAALARFHFDTFEIEAENEELVFWKLNSDVRPAGYKLRSMSVGDIVLPHVVSMGSVAKQNDAVGFRDLDAKLTRRVVVALESLEFFSLAELRADARQLGV